MCGKLDCAVGGMECLYQHHGALYNDIFKTSLFDSSLASHYNLSPVDIRKSVECLFFWGGDYLRVSEVSMFLGCQLWQSVKCRDFWLPDLLQQTKPIKSEEHSDWMDW